MRYKSMGTMSLQALLSALSGSTDTGNAQILGLLLQ